MALREHELKNNYIGEYKAWEPWEHTLAYYPLKSDVKDYSGNNKNGTLTWTGVYEQNWLHLQKSEYVTLPWQIATSTPTLSLWIKVISAYNYNLPAFWQYQYNQVWKSFFNIAFNGDVQYWTSTKISNYPISCSYNNSDYWTYASWWVFGERNHICATFDWTKISVYKNWILENTKSVGWITTSNATNYNWHINKFWGSKIGWNWECECIYSEAIYENKVWTADEVLDYYNWTKSNYWL